MSVNYFLADEILPLVVFSLGAIILIAQAMSRSFPVDWFLLGVLECLALMILEKRLSACSLKERKV